MISEELSAAIELWKKRADAWTDLESAASLLEDTKSAIMSQMMVALGDMPVSKAELQVKASPIWMEKVKTIGLARTAANKAKVEMDYARAQWDPIKMRAQEWQSKEANERLMAKL